VVVGRPAGDVGLPGSHRDGGDRKDDTQSGGEVELVAKPDADDNRDDRGQNGREGGDHGHAGD
jgi:hypothetical protein